MTTYTGYFAQSYFSTASGITLKSLSAPMSLAYLPSGTTGWIEWALWMGLVDPSGRFIQSGSAITTSTPLTWYNFSEAFDANHNQIARANGAASGSSPELSITHSDINHNWVATIIGDSTSQITISDSNFGGSGVWKVYAVLEAFGANSVDQADFINGTLSFYPVTVTKSDGNTINLNGVWTCTSSQYLAGSSFTGWCNPTTADSGTNLEFPCSS